MRSAILNQLCSIRNQIEDEERQLQEAMRDAEAFGSRSDVEGIGGDEAARQGMERIGAEVEGGRPERIEGR